MSATEQMQVVQSIYDQFFASLTEAPAGKPAVGSKDNIFVLIEKRGRLIRSQDFANPWSPGNTAGSQEAAVNLANLANEIPQLSSIYAPNQSKITEIYQMVLNAQVIPPPPDPNLERSYDEAHKVLYRLVTTVDSETGETITREVETTDFTEAKKLRKKFDQAVVSYMTAYLDAMQTDAGRRNWPLLGRAYQTEVDEAWDNLSASDIVKVEDALAQKAMASNNAIGRAFADSKQLFNSYNVKLDGNVDYWRSRALPSDWHDPNVATDWPTMQASSSSYFNETSSEFTSYGGGGFVGVGLWTVGGGFNSTEQEEHFHSESQNISVSFKYAIVTLDRPWLNYTLLKLPGWSVSGIAPKFFSNGTKETQKDSLFPLLPQAFIVVRDVRITATWGETDRDFISKAVSGSASVGWGPFSVAGSYSHSSSTETVKAKLDGSTLTIPGMQIMGWICNVVPACPPQ